jgi:hypothetical protein
MLRKNLVRAAGMAVAPGIAMAMVLFVSGLLARTD